MTTDRYHVLLIEDNLLDAAPIRVFLHDGEFTIQHAITLADGLRAYHEKHHDVILLDRSLPDSDGSNTLKTVRRECADVPVVMLTGAEGVEIGVEAVNLGAQDFLPKGQFDAGSLKRSLRYAIERHASQRRLEDQAMLLDSASDAIMVTDLSHRIQYWNQRAAQLYGWSGDHAKQARTIDLFEPDSAQLNSATNSVLLNGGWSGEVVHRNREGQPLIFQSRRTLLKNTDGQGRAILVINTDVTEKRAIEQTVERSQRLETIGALAAGVAHDFNNVLAPILMGIQLLRPACSNPRQRKMLDKMKASAERGTRSVKDLMSFSRPREGEPVLVDSEEVIRKIARLCEGAFPRAVDVKCEPSECAGPVLADPAQLEHALMNLCLNAQDALPDGGELMLRTESIDVPDHYQPTQLESAGGCYSAFIITDNGRGIEMENLPQIFQPYFTTKPPGKGSGNGLNAVLGVVKRINGFIDVVSMAGSGTTISVCVPAAERQVEVFPKPVSKPEPAPAVAWD
ncbi:MAG: two-component system cell cycle sensor histidine kinase/response regulator CckA [Limisphaerales bacterium]|jgi:two-component system cell cycle sensor histidine kinase/response regulator CckA